MSETVKRQWLEDKDGVKVAPRTLTSQITTDSGVLLEQKIQDDINEFAAINNLAFVKSENNDIITDTDYNLTTKDIADDVNTSNSKMVLSAKQGKVINDRISNIIAHNNDTEGNSELLDIRVDIDGNTHDSAGDAVRSQISTLSSEIEDMFYYDSLNFIKLSTFTSGGWYHFQTNEFYENNKYSYSELIPTNGIKRLVSNSKTSHICFHDSNRNHIGGVVTNQTTGGVSYGDIIDLPSDTAFVRVSILTTEISDSFLRKSDAKNNMVVVDINGNGDYKSVVEAVDNEAENTVIIVKPGVYIGTVEAFEKRIILIGTDRNTCIIKTQSGSYSYPPINGSCGYFDNLTIYAEYVEGVSNEIPNTAETASYAFHCEHEYGVGKTLEFHHCTLKSDFFSALGIGVRKDFTLILDDCELINNQTVDRGPNYSAYGSDGKGLGALFLHDSVGEQGNSYLKIKDTVFKSTLGNAMCLYNARGGNNKVYCEFINNTLYDEVSGLDNNLFKRGGTFGDVFVINGISHGNTNEELNA